MKRELKKAEAHPDSEARTKKVDTLSALIAKKKERQAEIDHDQDRITDLFKDLDKVSPGQVNEAISISYSHQALARSSHDLIKEIKRGNS